MNKSKMVSLKDKELSAKREEHRDIFMRRRGDKMERDESGDDDDDNVSGNDSGPEIVASFKEGVIGAKRSKNMPLSESQPAEDYATDEEDFYSAPSKTKKKAGGSKKLHNDDGTNGVGNVHRHPLDEDEDAKWERQRKERAKEQYQLLLKKEMTPSPRGRYFLADLDPNDRRSYVRCMDHIARHPQDNIGFKLGEERPIYCIFQQKRPHAFLPHLAILDTGELRSEVLRKYGYQDDIFQANKPRSPKPEYPAIGQSKACLSLGDLENLRREGPALIQRGKELTSLGISKPRFITLGGEGKEDKPAEDEETASTNSTTGNNSDLPPSRILMHMDDRGEVVYQFYRIASAPNGHAVDAGNNRFTLRIAEIHNLLLWLPAIFDETYRLASSRVATNVPMTKELRDTFNQALRIYLVERVHGEGFDMKETDPELVYDFLADVVRSTSSAQLKRDCQCKNGNKENFQAYHLEVCCDGALKKLVKEVRSTIMGASAAGH